MQVMKEPRQVLSVIRWAGGRLGLLIYAIYSVRTRSHFQKNELATSVLQVVYRKSLETGRMPKDWNTAYFCPFFKKRQILALHFLC